MPRAMQARHHGMRGASGRRKHARCAAARPQRSTPYLPGCALPACVPCTAYCRLHSGCRHGCKAVQSPATGPAREDGACGRRRPAAWIPPRRCVAAAPSRARAPWRCAGVCTPAHSDGANAWSIITSEARGSSRPSSVQLQTALIMHLQRLPRTPQLPASQLSSRARIPRPRRAALASPTPTPPASAPTARGLALPRWQQPQASSGVRCALPGHAPAHCKWSQPGGPTPVPSPSLSRPALHCQLPTPRRTERGTRCAPQALQAASQPTPTPRQRWAAPPPRRRPSEPAGMSPSPSHTRLR